MKTGLAKKQGEKVRIKATIKEIQDYIKGKKIIKYLLLADITCTNTKIVLADHTWVSYGKKFQELNLDRGDIIEFDANIRQYIKNSGRVDYGLAWYSNIKKIGVCPRTSRTWSKDDIAVNYRTRIEIIKNRILADQTIINPGKTIKKVLKEEQKKLIEDLKYQKLANCPHCKKKFPTIIKNSNVIKCVFCNGSFIIPY